MPAKLFIMKGESIKIEVTFYRDHHSWNTNHIGKIKLSAILLELRFVK